MAIAILTTGLFPSATVGQPYSFTFTGTSGAPVSSAVNVMQLGLLPSGLSFNVGSVDIGGFWFITLSGTPNGNLGTFTGSIAVSDAQAFTAEAPYTMYLGLPSCSSSSSCPAKTVSSGNGTSVRISG